MTGIPRLLLRAWRLAALGLAACILHSHALRREQAAAPPSVSLDQARHLFPTANRLSPRTPGTGGHTVLDAAGRPLGSVLTTSPVTDDLTGYSGPNNILIGLDPDGRIVGAELLSSADTPAHAADVRRNAAFWRSLTGWNPASNAPPRIEAVAGSTLTSLGIAEAVERRLAGHSQSLRFPDPVTLDEIRPLLPDAASLHPLPSRPGWDEVRAADGRSLGFAVRTSPHAETARGHSGPTEALALVTPDARTVRAVRLRRSYDSPEYAERVRDDAGFLSQLAGRTVSDWARIDFRSAGFEGVSGATETSYAVAEGLRRRFAADALGPQPTTQGPGWKPRDSAVLAVLAGSLALALGRFRTRGWVRRGWQAVLIGILGLGCGDLLSLALLAGWAQNGIAWTTGPALVLLAAAALLVPWSTGSQIYCHHLCPHGAAQEWIRRAFRPKLPPTPGPIPASPRTSSIRLAQPGPDPAPPAMLPRRPQPQGPPSRRPPWLGPARTRHALDLLPWLLLAAAFLLPLAGLPLNLAALEPFDAWTRAGTFTLSAILAVAGLAASARMPMAYCRYGCPTGALLRFVRAAGPADRPGFRDLAALLLLLIAGALVALLPPGPPPPNPSPGTHDTLLSGHAFGTTWSVRLRGPVADSARLESALADELGRIENLLSHWRPASATSQFNAASTTLPVEMPPELVALVARCLAISAATQGAFDITVAPLVRAWGFGPGSAPPNPPARPALDALLDRCGWRKLAADTNLAVLTKHHPGLQIDLGAILQGYAADRLAQILAHAGQPECLIEVGGELLARGAWLVAVEDPANPGQPLRRLSLRDAALATSGTYRTRRPDGGRTRSHLIDPATGSPVQHDTILVSVTHTSAAVADAWATGLLVQGASNAMRLAHSEGLGVLAVTESGARRLVSPSPLFPEEPTPTPPP